MFWKLQFQIYVFLIFAYSLGVFKSMACRSRVFSADEALEELFGNEGSDKKPDADWGNNEPQTYFDNSVEHVETAQDAVTAEENVADTGDIVSAEEPNEE